jgi:hypothetical protein
MRIVMPLFDFFNGSGQEFSFGDGTYCLRRFDPNTDIPKNDIPGLSEMDIQYNISNKSNGLWWPKIPT